MFRGFLKLHVLFARPNHSKHDVPENAAIQFPQALLQEGARFVVDGLQEAEGAKYYRLVLQGVLMFNYSDFT